jgi:beta-galactosidase
LNRRRFLKNSTLTAGATLMPAAISQTATRQGTTKQTAPQKYLPLNRGWLFRPHTLEQGHAIHLDESGFERVVLPHTNKVLPWHSFSETLYEFISTYRRHFTVPASAKGKRVFVDFEGVMTASTVWINGVRLGEYQGGYTPFSFELTSHIRWAGDNVLAVEVDSRERADIPPFGYEIDYLTFGGIYREVNLRVVPDLYLENVFARPQDVLSGHPSLAVECFFNADAKTQTKPFLIEVVLRDGDKVVASDTVPFKAEASAIPGLQSQTVRFENLQRIELWSLHHPKLYSVDVKLLDGDMVVAGGGKVVDQETRRIGFREAKFTSKGFSLNGEIIKLRGLDRHQTFPFVGQAMPARVQKKDAEILRRELKCNIVRTSHYPQSRHFLDACDELGLLVLEEIPGWQHIGDLSWQDIAVDNVKRMICRDWNHPSIILWGVRINESKDDHDFYTRTNAMAHALDATRQTGGIRSGFGSELLEDVYTMNDFGFPLKSPTHPLYLNTEFVGHTFPTRSTDTSARQREHMLRHARIHNQIASDPQFSGGIGWCAFDYNTHANFGSGDRICYHGVSDIFRQPKIAAGFYRSQCDPAEEVVLEPAFHWARNDEDVGISTVVICSNCEQIKLYLDGGKGFVEIADVRPNTGEFPHLRYAPFFATLSKEKLRGWGNLRMDGYIGGKRVISRTHSGQGYDHDLQVRADDHELVGDGADTTRIVLRVVDEFGQLRPIAGDAITFTLDGPARLIGPNPFSLVGGTGAVWVRTLERPGLITVKAKHPVLGERQVQIRSVPAPGILI